MNDQTTDQQEPAADITALTGADHAAVKATVDTIIDLDTILSSARLVERTERICVDGTLEREFKEVLRELSSLVQDDGTPLDEEDVALGEETRIEQLGKRANELRAAMDKVTLAVTFRALPSDEWEEFDKSHKTGSGQGYKDSKKFENELIATCAIAPVLTADDVAKKLRKKLNQAQFVRLYNVAFAVNNMDGVDIPKSPSFLHAPRPQE